MTTGPPWSLLDVLLALAADAVDVFYDVLGWLEAVRRRNK